MPKKKKENKLDIPESFQLFGETITVEMDITMSSDRETCGASMVAKNLIKLDPQYGKPEYVEATFYHELTHMILSKLDNDLTNDEKFVTAFSGLLYQYIKTRNPK